MAIDFTLGPELEELRLRVRDFIQQVVKPVEEQIGHPEQIERAEYTRILLQMRGEAKAAGLWLPHMPVEWGGMGLGHVQLAMVQAEAAKAYSAGMARLGGIPIAPDSFLPYWVSISVGLQVLFLPILGAIADYSHLRKQMMRLFATIVGLATVLLFFTVASTWWLGGLLFILANLAFGAAMVFYNSYLPDIASEDKRDSVSSYGWAMGYLGGGLLLVINLVLYLMADSLGLDESFVARLTQARVLHSPRLLPTRVPACSGASLPLPVVSPHVLEADVPTRLPRSPT